jgi:hypothetical protein
MYAGRFDDRIAGIAAGLPVGEPGTRRPGQSGKTATHVVEEPAQHQVLAASVRSSSAVSFWIVTELNPRAVHDATNASTHGPDSPTGR